MYTKTFAASAAVLMALSGCATIRTNAVVGVSFATIVGATSGAAIGSPEHMVKGALIGTAIGAGVGGLVAYLLADPRANKTDKKAKAGLDGLLPPEPGTPKLTAPVVRKVWVEDTIQDGKYVQGHYIWVLERGSVWSMP